MLTSPVTHTINFTNHIKVYQTFHLPEITSKSLLTVGKHGINAISKPYLMARNDEAPQREYRNIALNINVKT